MNIKFSNILYICYLLFWILGSAIPLMFIILNKLINIITFKLIKYKPNIIWQIYNLLYCKIFFNIKVTDYRSEEEKKK